MDFVTEFSAQAQRSVSHQIAIAVAKKSLDVSRDQGAAAIALIRAAAETASPNVTSRAVTAVGGRSGGSTSGGLDLYA